MPFADDTFDAAWMQNVGMNIADKRSLYTEVHRVLKPGGRFAFQEMAAGTTATSYFPLPWASEPAYSILIPGDEMCAILGECGFITEIFEDTSDLHLKRTAEAAAQPQPQVQTPAQTQLGLAVFVDNLGLKAGNAKRSLQEGQIRLVRGVFRAK